MERTLRLARRGVGATSPNPMVGAVLVKGGQIIGEGWHKRAGEAHAEVNALSSARRRGHDPVGATLYVTLEPCSTRGRTPPCTEAIIGAGIKRVVVAATDPNPNHAGGGFELLARQGIEVSHGLLAAEAERLNEAFNHWIVHGRPHVTLKSAMTLDGKIATSTGESKWITGPASRKRSMALRLAADAILVGINTVLRDDPALTLRLEGRKAVPAWKVLRRIVLDGEGRTPLAARVLAPADFAATTIVAGPHASKGKIQALAEKVEVIVAPQKESALDLAWLMDWLGERKITSVLIEGGGETHAHFLAQGLGNRVAFFYAPKIIGGRTAPKAIGGLGVAGPEGIRLENAEWEKLGEDLFLTACIPERGS